jgi:methylmalonyl-CoA mutase
LAFSLATAVEYLRQMAKRGLPVDVVAPRTRFAITVGVKFFTEISKLRAMRMLWSRAVAAAGGDEKSQKLSLHVRTSRWNKTVYDPYNNMLRTTIEAFAGVLGGCDSMQVGAFDEILRQPDDFSQRIARNTQLILQKECNLTQVTDPAGGSWYVEVLTAELANRAWALFQEIEKLGGMEAALRAGFPQKQVADMAAQKLKAVRGRRDSIVGVNQYANVTEKPLEIPVVDNTAFHKRRVQQITSHRTSLEDDENEAVLSILAKIVILKDVEMFEACVEAVSKGATIGEVTRAIRINDSPSAPITPVHMTRAAEPVEKLRIAMDKFLAKGNERPAAFLCNMGSLKEYKARADFSRGFISVGGFKVVSPNGFKTPEDAVAGFVKSGAKIAVICSVDDNYPALVPALTQGIRAAKPDAIIVLAGYPQEHIEAFKKAGVDEFIHIKADVCETLNKFHAKLGIA